MIDLWGSATLRTGGEEIAQGLALMGCRPTWEPATGRVTVHPTKDAKRGLDLYEIALDLEAQGIQLPLLLRFSDILRTRIQTLSEKFESALEEFDYKGAAALKYVSQQGKIWKQIPPLGPMNIGNAFNGFYFNYYKAAWGLVKGLQAVHGNITPNQKALQAALAKVTLNTPFGLVKLDSNRQTVVKTVQFIPNVNQTFGGVFSRSSPPPGRTQPPCKKASLPWAGKEKPVVNGVIK